MTPDLVSRRTFLIRAGSGTIALAVVGIAGCAPAAVSPEPAASSPTAYPPSLPPGASDAPSSDAPSSDAPAGGVAWHRVNLGFVSAYVLVRSGEAAVVDTGVAGSEGDIEAALVAAGLGWNAVGHLILTHLHSDHIGSAAAVMTAAPDATGYAGAGDIPGITVPRPLTPVDDGDRVFDLRIVATPGHTPGHISVLDDVGGILVAGDALNTAGGRATGPNPQFTPDMDTAMASVAKLAGFGFETLLVGHGDPVTSGASAQVAELAAG
ncbi:MAG TPA: MBL fold metallo-hydrolase [Candidatus Limnocylindrales bacterium]|nr:MBL fold metallo-hydrolase [Candidatus Limnocylindrales bacterium]